MRIASSTLVMSSQHTQMESYAQSEKLELWTNSPKNNGTPVPQDILNLSPDAQTLLSGAKTTGAQETEDAAGLELSEKDKHKIRLIEKFIEIVTGKKIKLIVPEKLKTGACEKIDLPGAALSPSRANANSDPGWGLRYEYHRVYAEAETMSFAAAGTITTKDGKQISLNLTLEMNRAYVSEEHVRILAGNAKVDPLVINYNAASTGLTADKFAFDLDADGVQDQISFTTPGSGFLALDKNQDGLINDGTELFGPQSGSGFGELAAYDQDGNGWIDENDPIFTQLRIWTKDDAGKDSLLALGQEGVGAIYLGNISTDFSLKTPADNELQGQIRSTGLFLREDGTAGTVQHIDLAV